MSQIARKQFLSWSVASLGGMALSSLNGCSSDTAETNPVGTAGSAGTTGTAGIGGTGGIAAGGSGGTAGSGGAGGVSGSAGGAGGTAGGAGGATGGAGGVSGGAGGAGGASGGASGGGAGGAGGAGGTGGAAGAGGSGGAGANMCAAAEITAEIFDNHGHELVIPMADITAGLAKTYDAQGEAGHSHFVELTADDFTALKMGMTVRKYSCNGGDHQYVLSCAAPDGAPAAPTCNDDCGEDANTLCADL